MVLPKQVQLLPPPSMVGSVGRPGVDPRVRQHPLGWEAQEEERGIETPEDAGSTPVPTTNARCQRSLRLR